MFIQHFKVQKAHPFMARAQTHAIIYGIESKCLSL